MMRRNKKKNSRNNKNMKGAGKVKRLPNTPFPLLATPDLGHTFQFTALNALSEVGITRANILNLISVAATATNAYSIIGAARIKKIRIWSPIISAFTPQEVQIEWNGGLYSPSAIHSATSEGLFPAKLETSPPHLSSPDLWSLTAGAVSGTPNAGEILFSVSCPAGSVIQVSLALRLMDDEAAPTVFIIAGGTVGKTYYGYLDGPPLTGNLQPSGGVAIAP
jgi:hypothetical protein